MIITLRPLPFLTTSQILTSAQQRLHLSSATRLFFTSLSSSDGPLPRTIITSTAPQLSPVTGYDSLRMPWETGNSRSTLRFECPSLRDLRTSSFYPISPKLQLTTAFQPASRDQSSGKHTPEDFDHGLSQPNIRSTRTLNTDCCISRNIQQDARQWTKYCLAQPARSTTMHEVHNPTASHSSNPVSAVPTPVPPLPKTLLL
ncbi:unnamed protein product [Rodentolepis nana]|uniref:Uncharacterized protein n=1 Tax=Rodentolepis nana TaxID=102285 RepID=A0A0R3TNA2_RODNA|nr:unnamed protein product [Rodentolepis nana]